MQYFNVVLSEDDFRRLCAGQVVFVPVGNGEYALQIATDIGFDRMVKAVKDAIESGSGKDH